MIELIDKNDCCGCRACFNICPKKAIKMKEYENGFSYPTIDREKCVECEMCKKVCPIMNKNEKENEDTIAYACYSRNEKIKKSSSSGGIFTLVAEKIINLGGVVFGAAFDSEFRVAHSYVEKKEKLYKYRGSKYVESDIGNNYRLVKEFLEKDRYVLFSGTPCQVEGLYKYLQKDYKKLYTQDIVCHGVPSSKAWKKYIEELMNIENSSIKKVNFRNKDKGWNEYQIAVEFKNGKIFKENFRNNEYMKMFLKNVALRRSCYNCKYKTITRSSDITLADFWGIKQVCPEMYNKFGTSLVVIHTDKGNQLFEELKDKINYKKVDINEAIKFNSAMIKSVKQDANTENFIKDIETESFKDALKKYITTEKTYKRIMKKIKRFIKKLLGKV